MRTLLLSGVAALALGMTGAYAQSNTTTTAPAATASDANGQFIDRQAEGQFRAPKLVGVAVYDSNNKDVGKIADLLLDKDGQVKTVVISVGGFLGIGSKDVAVPYNEVHWQTEQRTAATNEPAGNATATNGTMANTTTNSATNTTNANAKMNTAQAEAYQGYPDRAVIDMSQAQLKSAPTFKYASQENMGATTNTTTTKKP